MLAVATLFGTTHAHAASEDDSSRPPAAAQNILLADLGLHVVGIGYQRTVRPHLAAQVAAEWYVPWTQNPDAQSALVAWGLALRTRLMIHPFGDAPNGLWLSPVGTWGFGTADVGGTRRSGPMWSLGGSVGYAVTLFGHLYASAGAGVQYNVGRFGGSAPPSYARWFPTVDAAVGYAF